MLPPGHVPPQAPQYAQDARHVLTVPDQKPATSPGEQSAGYAPAHAAVAASMTAANIARRPAPANSGERASG